MTTTVRSSAGSYYCPRCERTYAVDGLCPEDASRLVRLDAPDPIIGRVLDGRYTVTSKLGAGGMGAVYRATQHSIGRDVAIKVMAPTLVSDANAIKRFLREAKLASRLSHPHAVGVLDFGQTPDHAFYLVMELVEGQTLGALLDHEGPLPPARALRIAIQMCDALEGAHRLQIIHRDLKPANVMVVAGSRDLIKVLDFGVARSLADDQLKVTTTGAPIGTPAFMAPELAGGDEADGRADLYSLGCMMYLMISGRLPFVASATQEMLAAHITERPDTLADVEPTVMAPILRLLEKDPVARFADAAGTREALEAALYAVQAGHAPRPAPMIRPPVSVTAATIPERRPAQPRSSDVPQPPATPAGSSSRTRRGLLAALTTSVALLGAAVTFVLIHGWGDRHDEPASPSSSTAATPTPPPAVPPSAAASRAQATTAEPVVAGSVASGGSSAFDAGVAAPSATPKAHKHERGSHHRDAGGTDDTTEPF